MRTKVMEGGRHTTLQCFSLLNFWMTLEPRDIDEVVIPIKRDIWGRRYDFVNFFNVKDVKMLATKLDNIFMGRHKIFMNVRRF